MKKAIIVVTGTPDGKNKFNEIAKESCWIWHVNAKNHLGRIAKNELFSDGERDEKYNRFISDFFRLVNDNFNFESRYIMDLLENKFLQDTDEIKTADGKSFDKFLFVIHGLSSKELLEELESEHGAIQIHISSRELNSNVETHDKIYYYDDVDFEQQIKNAIEKLVQ